MRYSASSAGPPPEIAGQGQKWRRLFQFWEPNDGSALRSRYRGMIANQIWPQNKAFGCSVAFVELPRPMVTFLIPGANTKL